MDITEFCDEYQLGNNILQHLQHAGIHTMNPLFHANEEDLTWRLRFNIGSVAEIQAALKRRLADKHPGIMVATPRIPKALDISGGVGGAGGEGDIEGGAGGKGKGGLYDRNNLLKAAVGVRIRGGKAGASGPIRSANPHAMNMPKSPTLSPGAGTWTMPANMQGIFVAGGEGGTGSWRDHKGGKGGEGEGPRISMFDVPIFRQIDGGLGGMGGDAFDYGGRGGNGAAPALRNLIRSISEKTRQKIPRTPLNDLGLQPDLLNLLKQNGFRTVAGLLELHDTDLVSAPGFKPGYDFVLKTVLDKFCKKFELGDAQQQNSNFEYRQSRRIVRT
ncbi:hypothetical protein R3P38DRAFT_332092 [Favolaschia claudopus]|uniref:Uncharacterized protein n=1 Tax=Favolaschia claudopus TaxID=2862362 RepID=A0AAV9ZMF4_9AGAR